MFKGQITLFIILGALLLILIAGAAFFVTKTETQKSQIDIPRLADEPTAIQPFVGFYQTCLRQVARDGLRQVGMHGGYTSNNQLRANPYNPTGPGTNSVNIFPNVNLKAAYWHYLNAPNDCEKAGTCVYDTKRPPLNGPDSIASQLANYVEENINTCMQSFDSDLIIEEQGLPKARVTINDQNIQFVVHHPHKILVQGQEFSKNEFVYVEPLNLKEIYSLATKLTDLEGQYNYLEKMTLELIDAFSGREKNDLPPIADFEVSLSAPQFWTKFDSERILRDLLLSHVSLLQVLHTKDYAPIIAPAAIADPELFELIYNRNFLIPLEEDHQSISANFVYLDWPIYFDLNCPGQVCTPESMVSNWFPIPLGLHRTNFLYDISYPVMVELSNPDAFNGEGYSFRFFLETNMRNNKPLNNNYAELADLGLPKSSQYCDPTKWHTPAEITLKDGYTNQPVPDAGLTYACKPEQCIIGGSDEQGLFKGSIPSCIGGTLSILHPDYETVYTPLDSDLPVKKEIKLYPYTTVNVKAKKIMIKKVNGGHTLDLQNPAPLRPYEQAIIMLTKNATGLETPYSTVAEISGDPFKQELNQLRLVPGTYEVRIIATAAPNPAWEILPKEKCFDSGLFNEKCVTLPEEPIRFNKDKPFPTGDHTMEWTITPDMLKGAKEITFKYVSYELSQFGDNTLDDLENIGLPAEITKNPATQEHLQPEVAYG